MNSDNEIEEQIKAFAHPDHIDETPFQARYLRRIMKHKLTKIDNFFKEQSELTQYNFIENLQELLYNYNKKINEEEYEKKYQKTHNAIKALNDHLNKYYTSTETSQSPETDYSLLEQTSQRIDNISHKFNKKKNKKQIPKKIQKI